ncbi:extracellular solute-binding protein [Halomarina oriensis]|uniref:Extracellular solute-binding protein n=2 Tax=Halomarina oriensis TaxID=671145 RepID=A0A6B0GN94_9EURY|nr:extracellular solute-binding protein [Halomarina oriensis]
MLTDYASEAWQAKWQDDIIPGFEEEVSPDYTVTAEYVGLQGTGEQRLTTLLQSGTPPEMYFGTITQVADLVAQDQTAPLGDLVSRIEEANGEMYFKSTVTVADSVQMVPHGLYLGGTLNYRQDIYDMLGLSVPETWDQLLENARAISESDETQALGFATAAQPAGKAGSDFANFLANSGGGVFQATEDGGAEIWFDEQHVTESLTVMQDLAEFSPDPSSLNWGSTIENWVAGRIGQCIMNNAWLAGPAYAAGATDVALNTNIAPVPMQSDADPIDRGWALIDGTPVLSGSDNVGGAEAFLEYMYGSPEAQADKNLVEPMRFLPPYQDILETDAYQSAEIFQAEDGYFLDLNRRCFEEIAPNLQSDERPSTVATTYESRFQYDSEMVNAVLVQGNSPQQAYEDGLGRLETIFQEGQELASN